MLLLALLSAAVLSGCQDNEDLPTHPRNHPPVISALVAIPDTIGPSDSTVVVCTATDADGDSLVYDWQTDARLNIQGTPTWNKYVNNTRSPSRTFYNADLSNPINDSAWVYCHVRDPRGGGTGRHVFIILRDQ
jgi:hypothetical protein